jgi:uncharacterized protein YggE
MDKQSLNLRLDYRILTLALLAVVISMLAVWRPWEGSETRKITVSGQATVKAVPDEFVFYPSFSRTASDAETAKSELNTFGQKLLNEVKALGVPEEKIKLDSSSYDYYYPVDKPQQTDEQTVTLQVTITVDNKELAQKVQDYLASTDAKGQLTAQASFSTEKQKTLEAEARQKAIEDAKSKADQTAANLNSRLGNVLEISDGTGFGGCYGAICPMMGAAEDSAKSSRSSLPVTPGENELNFTVQVIFALR